MIEQNELFELDLATNKLVRVERKILNGRLPLVVILLSLAFLFSVLAFLLYMLWDFGIAGRVILFLILILVIVHAAIFIAKQLIDGVRWRR